MAVAGNPRTGSSNHTPQVMTDVNDVYQYGIIIRLDGDAIVAQRDLATGAIIDTSSALSGIPSNPLGLPFTEGGVDDDHHALVLAQDGQGRLHIMGNSFASSLRYVRSSATAGVPDLDTWTDALASIDVTATGVNAHTYHALARRADGTLLWCMDQRDDLGDGLGLDRILFSLPPGSGTTWSPVVGTGEFLTAARVTDGTANRVYLIGMTVDTTDRVHFAGIWRTDDEEGDSQQQPFYFYSDDLTTFRNVEGTAVTIPMTWANRATVAITSAPAFSTGFGQGVAVDEDGYPHIVVENNDGDLVGIDQWAHLYWDGADWQADNIIGPGSSYGPSLHRVRGELFLLSSGAGRTFLRTNAGGSGSSRFRMGGPVDSVAENGVLFEPNPDPIRLRDGIMSLWIADGDTPAVFEFGAHHRCHAS